MSAAVLQQGGESMGVPQFPLDQQHEDGIGGADDPRPTLLVTTVDIGDGQAGRIELRLGDDPVEVARVFCARHNLPDSIVLPLAQHLEENLAEHAAAANAATGSDFGLRDQAAAGNSEGEEVEDAGEEAPAPAMQPSGRSMRSLGSRPGSGGSTAAANSQAAQQQQPDGYGMQHAGAPLVEQSSRSAGNLGPRPMTAAAAVHRQQRPVTAAPTYRPATTHSARAAEYYNRPPPTIRSMPDSEVDSTGGLQYRSAGSGSAGSGGSGGSAPAHNRLYAHHFRKQQKLEEERKLRDLEIQLKTEQVHMAPVSKKLAGHRNEGAYRNYGERLYVEGRLDAMRREQEAQRLKEEEARAELEQYTFQPEISKLAQQIKQTEGITGNGSVAAGERLYQRAQGTAKRQERMEAIRREQDEAEVAECSFRPQINSKSVKMVEQRQQILRENGLPGYEQLYNDSLRRHRKLQALAAQLPEELTFHPKVNTSSVALNKLMEGREGGSTDVASRLLERGRRYQEKLKAAQRQVEEAPRDPSTGQPLFKPKTYRPPQYERNPDGAPIGEYLYSIKAEWDEKATRVRDARERQMQQNASSSFVNNRSERMVDRLKRERFRAIFEYLRRGQPSPVLNLLEAVEDESFMDTIDPEVRADVEYAGRLLAKSISRRQVNERLRDCATSAPNGGATSAAASGMSVGAPPDTSRSTGTYITANTAAGAVSSYGQSTNGELDVGGFVALMEEVIARTKGLTRQYLLPMPSGRQKFDEPTFRPAIDPKSYMMACRLRPETLPAYEVLYKTAEELAAKKEEQRRAAEAARLKECIFHPVMVAQSKGQEGRAIKKAVELTQSKRASDGKEASGSGLQKKQPSPAIALTDASVAATPVTAAPAAAGTKLPAAAPQITPAAAAPALPAEPSGDQLHFDALERQINEALVRLSMSEEAVAASLKQAAPMGCTGVNFAAAADMQVAQSVDANGYRLDWRTICGSPSPDGMLPSPGVGDTPGESSLAGFNPLDESDAVFAAEAATRPATVAWEDHSQEVVAHVSSESPSTAAPAGPAGDAEADAAVARGSVDVGGIAGMGEELSGLDLHALASTDLPEHERHLPAEAEVAAAVGTGEQAVTVREV